MKKLIAVILILIFLPLSAFAKVTGIYLTQETAQNSDQVAYLIKNAKEVGINTFVVDYERADKRYNKNIEMIQDNDINYVARIVIFPGGATPEQVKSQPYLDKKLNLIKQAVALGADEIQLDYIRYKASQPPSDQNAENIASVVRYFKKNAVPLGVPLQIDVFGVSTFAPSVHIGQNLELLSAEVEAICPMVYPSHYEPFRVHARQPYKTIFSSITALKKQVPEKADVKVYAYIELFNYRYPMNHQQRKDYINAELAAVKDSGANGWYAWSAGNYYDILFDVLKQNQLAEKDANPKGPLAQSSPAKLSYIFNPSSTTPPTLSRI